MSRISIIADDARDMMDYFHNMDTPRKNFILRHAGALMEKAYGSHRNLTISKKSPLYLYKNISEYRNSTTVLEGVDGVPLIEGPYYQIVTNGDVYGIPNQFLHDVLRGPITTVNDYCQKVRYLEDWYSRYKNDSEKMVDLGIYNVYVYMANCLSAAYSMNDYMSPTNEIHGGSCDMFSYILNMIKHAIISPDSIDSEKITDGINSFYETTLGHRPNENAALVTLAKRYNLKYNLVDYTPVHNPVEDKGDLKPVTGEKFKGSDLYTIVNRLDRSNVPRIIQEMKSFKKWATEDSIINGDDYTVAIPDKDRYFDVAITGLMNNDLPFISAATDSRVIPVRGTSNQYYHFIIRNNKPLILYKLLPITGKDCRYFAISLDPSYEVIGEITKDPNVKTEFVYDNPREALGKFFAK
nr:MAG TPA: hypothetical protein [Caudoviricetes sp.]